MTEPQNNITPVPSKVNGHTKEAEPANVYMLSAAEQAKLKVLSAQLMGAKAEAFAALEKVRDLECLWSGITQMLATSRNWDNAQLSPDFRTLTRT